MKNFCSAVSYTIYWLEKIFVNMNKVVKNLLLKLDNFSYMFICVDIDTIEIVAENDEEGSGASKNRRSYNYRVRSFYLLVL